MKSVFAVIVDQKYNYLVGKRYDIEHGLFFLGGTVYESGTDFEEVLNKVQEKSSFVLKIMPTTSQDDFYLSDGKNKLPMFFSRVFENGNQKFYLFFCEDDFSRYIGQWRYEFQENQIFLVDFIIKKIRIITPYISYVDWINMMVLYKGRYRSSTTFQNLLRKRGVQGSEIDDIISYLEFLEIYLRYQNLSVVTFNELDSSINDTQKDFINLILSKNK